MQRNAFRHNGLTLSWLDSGGGGRLLIALHAHWMEALTFARLASGLAPDWRVVALDQRGHGHSSRALSYTREDYLSDLEAFFGELGVSSPVVLLGNSLGGINAVQFASRHPERVAAIIIEDIGLECSTDLGFVRAWAGIFPTREALAERVGPRFKPYLESSFRAVLGGWSLAFDPEDMIRSENAMHGNYWNDWLATKCPALVIRGRDSRVTTRKQLEEMAHRRLNSVFIELEGGHIVHQDSPEAFVAELRSFLQSLQPGTMNSSEQH
ncbi:Hydrolase [Candidatus Sulfotelmatomonas gaucii]|uniref:Hydrolase n=1 Tax=Candidatus Sulfuritelmatomonas gaucii TaxID=2043161 RepID=A0A2N9L466_9BACT|nr:Hydrolase [Candidatus Sulfotelmatomonas gaucii]